MNRQSGFTLIELVIVIVLLGVLAAIAVPRFVNLQDDALQTQLTANAAAITSAMNINYAACAINDFVAVGDCVAVNGCDDGLTLLTATPAGYTVAATPAIPAGNGSAQTACVLTQSPGPPAVTTTFTAVRTAVD